MNLEPVLPAPPQEFYAKSERPGLRGRQPHGITRSLRIFVNKPKASFVLFAWDFELDMHMSHLEALDRKRKEADFKELEHSCIENIE